MILKFRDDIKRLPNIDLFGSEMKDKSKKIGVYINPDLDEILDKAVEREPFANTKSGFIRIVLKEHIKQHHPEIAEEG